MITHDKKLVSRKKNIKGGGIVNTLINKLPLELHLPGYNYCGPGTKLDKRLARGDKGINQLDEACREHDIAYSKNTNKTERHKADNILGEKAWQRFKARDSNLKEKTSALLVTGAMKAKVKLGMGLKRRVKKKLHKLKDIIKQAKTAVKTSQPSNQNDSIKIALKAAKNGLKKLKPITIPRVLPVPKVGGVLPLIPILAGLSAIGAIAGGASGIAKAVNDAKSAKKQLNESQRHNKTMEAIALRGKGLFLKPYKKGFGLYLNQKNY
jgi:hypothetical protein